MKKIHLALLCCLLLLGCTPDATETEATVPPTLPAAPAGYYDPTSPLEAATDGAVRCYPLREMTCSDLMVLGDNFLLISAGEYDANLTLLSGEEGIPTARLHINGWLSADTDSLHPWESGISFYEDGNCQTTVLDHSLKVVSIIDAPAGIVGNPILSSDRRTLYYCTVDSIRALELESGISRCLREMDYPYQVLTGLHMNDTVLECAYMTGSTGAYTMFLSAQTGEILHDAPEMPVFQSHGDSYYATFVDSGMVTWLFGNSETATQTLNFPEYALCYFLPEDHAAVTMESTEDMQILLNYFDLESGCRTAALTLPTDTFPWAIRSCGDGKVCFLNYDREYGAQVLHVWDTAKTPVIDNHCYTGIHYTREDPDVEGLAECRAYAREIGNRYGIEVLIHKEAAAVEPFDYDLEHEHLVGVLNRELELLDRNLSRYPEGFLSKLASRFDGLTVCIVRSLTGSAESGSLDTADGIQFLNNYRAYIALAAPCNTEYALYHEMCHLIDTVVISESGAYDRWDELNPQGFSYDYDYISNQTRDSSAYLQDSTRYFIDNYSMSFPKEDRARIMEYAMTEGNESYFQSATMQAKLKLLCEGIREAFDLQKSSEIFRWEQYLNTSLAYTE